MTEKTLEETVRNIDRNVEAANKKLSRLKDIFYMFSSFLEGYADLYYKTQESLDYQRQLGKK